MGSTVDTGLQCHTDLSICCSDGQGSHRGDWYFPDGSRLPFPSVTEGVSMAIEARRVSLIRTNWVSDVESGIYRCEIPAIVDPSTREVIYVGVYNTAGGTY